MPSVTLLPVYHKAALPHSKPLPSLNVWRAPSRDKSAPSRMAAGRLWALLALNILPSVALSSPLLFRRPSTWFYFRLGTFFTTGILQTRKRNVYIQTGQRHCACGIHGELLRKQALEREVQPDTWEAACDQAGMRPKVKQ